MSLWVRCCSLAIDAHALNIFVSFPVAWLHAQQARAIRRLLLLICICAAAEIPEHEGAPRTTLPFLLHNIWHAGSYKDETGLGSARLNQ